MDRPVPLIALEVLADRKKNPAALLIKRSDADEAASDLDENGQEELERLAVLCKCHFLPGQAGQENMEAAGWLPLPPGEWLAGDWYMGLPAKAGSSQSASRALALQLVELVVADADNHEIEAVLRRDPALSYHLLRLVNSLGVGAGKKVGSFSQAILILGRTQLRRWLNLMLFSSRAGDDRAGMLLARAASRARMMELLARAAGLDKAGQELAFMGGMFSLLGILFGMPLADVLRPLQISESLREALLEQRGELGTLLRVANHAQAADFASLATLLAGLQVGHAEFNLLVLQAYGWAMEVVRDSGGGQHG
ncbi:MAG TPA: HDOD domain-containing protein [Noviherbaspirillum sp.]|jgi:EAL and modified HD-GYP domain-containing signal transduction protein|uniref:EAL and HDOD domain-containing protein n=1 Tax=Noviherbaspirillum sp. TaxID=1926288 RepID=UPI002F952488